MRRRTILANMLGATLMFAFAMQILVWLIGA